MWGNKEPTMSNKPRNRTSRLTREQRRNLWIYVGIFIASLFLCVLTAGGAGLWLVGRWFRADPAQPPAANAVWSPDSAELTVAVSPVMAPVLNELVAQFNSQGRQTPDGQTMRVQITSYQPDQMVQAALADPPFQALSPDSSLWLDQLEQQWALQSEQDNAEGEIPLGERRTSGQTRYAVSPVVIAAWESVARDLGWPDQPVGWATIQQKATQDPNFKWNHPSTTNASGLLATLAEFYAGAGLTRGLTVEAATAQETLDYVRAVEATVRFYGEGEEVIVQRLAQEGRDFLDAFVAQERVVIEWNRTQSGERLVALYPAEGTLWTDHPLALLELGRRSGEQSVTENQRLVYAALAEFLTGSEAQAALLTTGYRPADLNIPLDAGDSPFANTDTVDWRQPQTTLQMPPPAVVEVISDFWYFTKRPTNVYLVVDTSGSMEGEKIVRAREALAAFVGEIKGDRDRVGLIEFGSGTKSFTPLRTLDDSARQDTLTLIDSMEALGGTALIDAVYNAVVDLQAQNDTEAINAIVVMTDGQENESYYWLDDLSNLVQSRSSPPLVIFTIAFGNDADESMLRSIAELGNGQFRRADETDIEELYRLISTYF
jgi:Ca-activated chloride channel homolog